MFEHELHHRMGRDLTVCGGLTPVILKAVVFRIAALGCANRCCRSTDLQPAGLGRNAKDYRVLADTAK